MEIIFRESLCYVVNWSFGVVKISRHCSNKDNYIVI